METEVRARSPRRGKAVALGGSALGVALLALAAYASRDRLREEYWLWRLRSGNEEQKQAAAEKLGDMRSVRAVRPLIELLLAMPIPGMSRFRSLNGSSEEIVNFGSDAPYPARALARIGRPAIPDLAKALREEPKARRNRAVAMLGFMGAEAREAMPAVKALPSGSIVDTIVRGAALLQIEGEAKECDGDSGPHRVEEGRHAIIE